MASLPLILSLSDGCHNDCTPGYYQRRNQHHYHHQANLDRNYSQHYGHYHSHHHSHHPGFGLVGPSCCVIHKEKCDDKECAPHAYPSAPTVGKDGFQVSLDVQLFKPNELTVKMVDNCIVVEGKHNEREDNHGHIARHFIRRYILPESYDSHDAVSTLSSDGILTVKVRPPRKDDSDERIVQIHQTGPAHLSVKCDLSDGKN